MTPRRKGRGSSPRKRNLPVRNLFLMAFLAGLGVLGGIWLSPHRSGKPVGMVKAPVPSLDSGSGLGDWAWINARLKVLWEDLGIPQENIVSIGSDSSTQMLPANLEVRLPKNVSLGSASRALEALARDPAARLEIRWEKEENTARTAVINLNGSKALTILLLEEPAPMAQGLGREPKIAIIMDDVGQDQRAFRQLMELGIPLTLSILPAGAQAQEMAREANSRGLEVMLHIPMEPKDYPSRKPGPHALMVSMDGQQIARLIQYQLELFPQASGANNHMGSKLTEDLQHMSTLMDVLAKRSMYFVDSLTSPHSVAYSVATQKGLKAYRRDVFLDNIKNPEGIREQFQVAMSLAKKKGHALAICHPYPETLALLPELYRSCLAQGIRWVKVSELSGEFLGQSAPLASRKPP